MARYILAVLMTVALTLPTLAIDPDAGSFFEVEGMVNSVQYNYFTVMEYKNTFARIMLKPGTNMPNQIMSGVQIRCTVVKDNMGQFQLYEIDALTKGALPAPTPVPAIVVPIPIPGVPVPIPVPIPLP